MRFRTVLGFKDLLIHENKSLLETSWAGEDSWGQNICGNLPKYEERASMVVWLRERKTLRRFCAMPDKFAEVSVSEIFETNNPPFPNDPMSELLRYEVPYTCRKFFRNSLGICMRCHHPEWFLKNRDKKQWWVKKWIDPIKDPQRFLPIVRRPPRSREFTRTLLPARSPLISANFLLIFCYFPLFSVQTLRFSVNFCYFPLIVC